jgi:putative DNA primase/helicase
MTPAELAAALGKARREGREWRCLCPAHDDHNPSLSVTEKDGKLVFFCFAGCDNPAVAAALRARGLWTNGHDPEPAREGVTLAAYAALKGLPAAFLESTFKLKDSRYQRAPCVAQPYFGLPGDGEPYPVKYRVANTGRDKTKWKKGSTARLYGLWRLPEFKARGAIILVEGESDTQTCWFGGDFPALGLPGAGGWNEERDAALLDGVSAIYVTIEPDNAGATLLGRLARSAIRDRLRVVRMPPETKDPSELYLRDPAAFPQAFSQLLEGAEEAPPPPPAAEETSQPPEYADDALASRFTEQHTANLRYVAKWARWMMWNESHWCEEDTLKAFDLARAVCREASAEVMGWATPNKKLASAIASAKTSAAVERLAKADRAHAMRSNQWDKDAWLFNPTEPGTINLKTGLAHTYRREDYITKVAGCALDGNCRTPIWDRFLSQITGKDSEVQAYLQRVAGYCLTGSVREHALFFLYGTGGNGKGVFVSTLRTIWGDYATAAPIELFCETRNERHPADLADLRGARLVVASETERNQRWAEAKIKSLTGGDPVKAHFMRKDPFEFNPQFKLMIAGNHKPSLRGVDEAIRRRLHLIPFTVTIPEQDRDEQLREKLAAEYPGILAWALQGCRDWLTQGLKPPEAVREATDSYLAEEDTIGRWLEERCGVDQTIYKEYSGKLYDDWCSWCQRVGERLTSHKTFTQTLKARGFTQERDNTGQRMFLGIGLKSPPPAKLDFNGAAPQGFYDDCN